MRTIGLASFVLLGFTLAAPTALADDGLNFDDLRRAVEETVAQKTVRLGAHVSWEAPALGLESATFMDATGQTTFGTGHRAWLGGSMEEFGEFGYVADGSDVYIRLAALDDAMGPGTYIHLDTSSPPPGFEELHYAFDVGNDAALALYWLLGVDGSVETLGTEAVDGGPMTWIEAPIDLELVRAHVPEWLRPIYERNMVELSAAGGSVDHAQAWIEDGLIRRIVYDMPLALDDEAILMRVEYDLSGFGEPIDLPLPDPADVIDAWELVGG